MSLRLKTILGIALIEGVLLMVLIYTALGYMRTTNYDALQARAESMVRLFATTTKDAVLSYDLASLDVFTSELLQNPGVLYVRVLDSDLQLLTSAGDETLLANTFQQDFQPAEVSDGVFDTASDILESGERFGQVQLGISTSQMQQVLANAERWSISIAAVEMVLVALFSFVLGTYLTLQLAHLRRAAKSVTELDLTVEVPVKGKDEVADVGRAFNTMIEGLRQVRAKRDQYEQELQQLNEELEQRVERRTQALLEKNTELEGANKQIKQAQSQLMQAEKMASLGQLAAGVAHEINNPLGFVSSNLNTLETYVQRYQQLTKHYQQALQAETDASRAEQLVELNEFMEKVDFEFVEEDIGDLLHDSREGAERVRVIVQGLKEFSHEGKEEWQLFDVSQCINNTVKMVNNRLPNNCQLLVDAPPLPATCCNPGQINQVLMNLVVNASQAVSDESGRINVRAREVDQSIEIRITDNGSGIAPEHLSKLFDPFFTTKAVGEGTGLGLAISYGIIKEHGGELTVKSKVGVGSVFCIRLPINADENDWTQPPEMKLVSGE